MVPQKYLSQIAKNTGIVPVLFTQIIVTKLSEI
jgi:hypothetical protein